MNEQAAGGPAPVPLRPPSRVMCLDRMGAGFATRLSFLRQTIRRLHEDRARVERSLWDIDGNGHGRAIYTLTLGGHRYSLVAFSHDLPPESRTDRVIAERWDTTYALFDGVPEPSDLDRLAASVPLQEAGRVTGRELVLSRANRSVRLFDHVVDALAAGRQPDFGRLHATGYLMRTTAVYGNGKFGLADRDAIAGRPGMSGPFQPEMLTVWLIRGFTHDLAEHVAAARAPDTAVRLAPGHRRALGIGNATGLGMAPFLVTHPELLHNWVAARETALARVLALPRASEEEIAGFRAALERAGAHAEAWQVDDPVQMGRIRELRSDLASIEALAPPASLAGPAPWRALMLASSGHGLEAQECLVSILLEPHGALIDDLAGTMAAGRPGRLDPAMRLGRLNALIRQHYGWALQVDFADPEACHQFWYVSEEKSEPRLGVRAEEPGAELELPLDIPRQVQALSHALHDHRAEDAVAGFLMARPDMRHVVTRVQAVASHPYGEIRGNLIGRGTLPIDLLRFKLAFFGASRFDPKSDRWTRITLAQGAPLADEIARADPDDWAFWSPAAEGAT